MFPSKYPRTYYWPQSPSIPKKEKVVKNMYDFIGNDLVFTEKLDGSNCVIKNGDVYNRGGTKPSSSGWNCMVKKHHAWKTTQLMKKYSFYGENLYGVHSIEYPAMSEENTFKLFAIKDDEQDIFLSWRKVEELASTLDMTTVPVLYRGTMDSIKEMDDTLATLIEQGPHMGLECEGVVVRHSREFKAREFSKSVMKYVRPNHVQVDARHWRHNWKPCKIMEMA